MTKRLFPADGVFWLVSTPDGTPSDTMWPGFAGEEESTDEAACACCCRRGQAVGADFDDE